LEEFRLLDTGPLSAAANMALDKIILEEVAAGASPPTMRFLQFQPAAALVGYHQDVTQEIRLDFCRDHGIDVNRRVTGGGGILFQESALGWELFGVPGHGPFRGTYERVLERICSVAASGLSRLGVSAAFRPRNDIEVHGRKISGTGGVAISGGMMFQGTLLVENEVELFVRALRVPVEKLKKRELESLMERICFLSDLMSPLPPIDRIKETLAAEFGEKLECRLVRGGLTEVEETRLRRELEHFQGPEWIMSRFGPRLDSQPLRSITQTDAGTLRVHLWPAAGARTIRQALICGDFFTLPARLVTDLEAALVGGRMEKAALIETVTKFLDNYNGEIVGITPERVANAIADAAERLLLLKNGYSREEVNELFLLNIRPEDFSRHVPRWLLLPYCSKNLDCDFRRIAGCEECGRCEIGDCFALARSHNMEPLTVQSFEHLMEILREKCTLTDGMYVGSCCEAFYAKHQREMEEVNACGVLVNLDSTTCYDMGKGGMAYKGEFDNKTFLNLPLIEKTLRRLHES
jgi:lipoate---protein ligase